MRQINDLLIEVEPEPTSCPYIKGYSACMENYVLPDPKPETLDTLIEQGFRHFGVFFFRPACRGAKDMDWCGACVPIRVDCAGFAPSRSQRRVLRRNTGSQLKIGPPRYTREKYELYLKHKLRFQDAIENPQDSEDTFRATFYQNCIRHTLECEYYHDGQLAGVSFLDIGLRTASSIYMFYDPDLGGLSLGVYSVLREIEHVRGLGIAHYYLGYWIQGNRFMRYKADYQPVQIHDGVAWKPLGAEERLQENIRTARWKRLI